MVPSSYLTQRKKGYESVTSRKGVVEAVVFGWEFDGRGGDVNGGDVNGGDANGNDVDGEGQEEGKAIELVRGEDLICPPLIIPVGLLL